MSLAAILLCALSGLSSGAGVLPDSVTAAVGGTVMFNTEVAPTQTPFVSIIWKFDAKNIISSNAVNTTAPEYEGRITLLISTGSLELRNIALNDTGNYSLNIIPEGGTQMNGRTTLIIFDNIANIFVKSSNPPVEGTSVNLTCDASGTIPILTEWMINGAELKPSENIAFYDENRVLFFRNLTRGDNGKYTCNISNPVSSQSADYEMNVNFGPDNVQISDPGKVQVGATLKLSCSAESVPTANFTWTKNGTTLAQSHEFSKDNVGFSDRGEYVCQAVNDITLKSSNASRTVQVTEGLSDGAIAGITIASLVAVAGVAAGGFHVYKHQKKRKQNNRNTGLEEENVYENTSNTGNFNSDEEHNMYENTQSMYDLNL